MGIFEGIAARLDQSSKLMDNLGVTLGVAELSAEHDIRNVIWRCILCRDGEECRDWLRSGARGAPEFCANREVYLNCRQARDAAAG